MEAELREAIRSAPCDASPRMALAELWDGSPEAELIRLMMEEPRVRTQAALREWGTRIMNRPTDAVKSVVRTGLDIQGWFERHAGLPRQVEGPPCECFDGDDKTTFDGWVCRAFDPDRWADREAWHTGVVAVARRMLPNAQAFLPEGDWSRMRLEEVAASETVPHAWSSARISHAADHRLAMNALWAAQAVSTHIYDGPGYAAGDAKDMEVLEQIDVIGWSWLGLPTLRPEAELNEPLTPVPGSGKKREAAIEPPRSLWNRLFG